AITPFERALVATGHFLRHTWSNYIDLHNVRKRNLELQQEVERLKLDQVRLREDAHQAQRLQALLGFKERFIGKVLPAQVIATSGSDQSRVISIDKGSRSGVSADMPVITPDGIVGKIKEVFPLSSQVLLINDRDSGAGVVLQNSRLQGVLRGTSGGGLNVSGITPDERVDIGEPVVTSGGDLIYPRGVPVGTVTAISPDRDNGTFLAVKVKPAADLNRLEEVLVVTGVAEQLPAVAGTPAPQRAADILAERLPSVSKPEKEGAKPATGTAASGPAPRPVAEQKPKEKTPSALPVARNPELNAEQKEESKVPPAQTKAPGAVPAAKAADQPAPASAIPGQRQGAKFPGLKPTPSPAATAQHLAAPAGQPSVTAPNQVKAKRQSPLSATTQRPVAPAGQSSGAAPNQVKKPKPQTTPSTATQHPAVPAGAAQNQAKKPKTHAAPTGAEPQQPPATNPESQTTAPARPPQ
ncbi:MAG: rod shape-determining protein MreC, partial [Acidobacteriota bacterium]